MSIWKLAVTGSISSANQGRRLVYRGHAVGAAGYLTRIRGRDDKNFILPEQASCSLPVIGGRRESRAKSPFWRILWGSEHLSVGSTSASATGGPVEVDRKWMTEVRAEARDIRLLKDKITVADVEAEIRSEFEEGWPVPALVTGSCRIAGLTLGRTRVDVHISPISLDAPAIKSSLDALSAAGKKRVDMRHIIRGVNFRDESPDLIYDSEFPNLIVWKEVGIVYLGELLISDFSHRLTMLRVEFGCPDKGSFCAGDVESVGHTVP